MRPLGQPEIRTSACLLTGHREFLGVGDAIDPDRFNFQEFGEADSKVARGRTGGNDEVRALLEEKPEDGPSRLEHFDFLGAIAVLDEVELSAWNVGTVAFFDGCVNDLGTFEGRAEPEELDPVATS